MVAMLAVAGCAIDNQDAPGFGGPSEFAMSLSVTATPDVILPDGSSAIAVTALDTSGNAIAGVSLRFRLINLVGSISSTSGTTDGAGRASFTYTGPGGVGVDTLVTIEVLPIGNNAQNLRARTVAVRVRS
jgi:hypothetical protein